VACGSSPGASARTPGASVETAEIKQGTLIPGIEPKVTAYLRTWPLGSDEAEFEEGSRWSARQIHGEYLGEIIIAFAHIDQDDKSTIIFPDVPGDGSWDLWAESAKLKKIWPHLKQHLSVGGWGAEFSDTAHDPDARAAFIANLCGYLERYDLDGADIDWEYPVGPDWGQEITSRPEDRDNYIALLTELRAAMDALGEETGKQYSLSACIPGSAWWVAKNDAVAVADIVDNLKLMSYDYYGGWSGNTGHLANLYNNPADPEWGGWSTDQAVTLYLDAGVPAEKITLGFAFYGRAWKGVEDGGANGLFQKYTESAYPDGLAWAQIKEFVNGGEYVRHWDDAARAPFLYNGDIFITYTDEEAIREIAAYAKEKGLGGVMVWEYGHDMDGELFSVLNESIQ
jgi:chitinase